MMPQRHPRNNHYSGNTASYKKVVAETTDKNTAVVYFFSRKGMSASFTSCRIELASVRSTGFPNQSSLQLKSFNLKLGQQQDVTGPGAWSLTMSSGRFCPIFERRCRTNTLSTNGGFKHRWQPCGTKSKVVSHRRIEISEFTPGFLGRTTEPVRPVSSGFGVTKSYGPTS